MYAVIFRAQICNVDAEYQRFATQLQELALTRYRCQAFSSTCENNQEIAVSWWLSEADIADWRRDPLHQRAQQLARERWYSQYDIEIVAVKRHHHWRRPSPAN